MYSCAVWDLLHHGRFSPFLAAPSLPGFHDYCCSRWLWERMSWGFRFGLRRVLKDHIFNTENVGNRCMYTHTYTSVLIHTSTDMHIPCMGLGQGPQGFPGPAQWQPRSWVWARARAHVRNMHVHICMYKYMCIHMYTILYKYMHVFARTVRFC